MTKCNVKTGDTVVVITGKDKGKKGKVLSVDLKKNRIVVEGVNIVSKHQKARRAQEQSQIVKKEGTIDVSNVMIVCPVCGKATRVYNKLENGKNVRVCKCGSALDTKVETTKKQTKKAAKEEAPVKEAEAKAEEKAETKPAVKKTATKTAEKKAAPKSVKATSTAKKTTTATAARKSQRGV